MWPPPNIHALPSKEEIQQIKEEIPLIELQVVEAQLKLEALQKSIAQRKAWIAPIRKVPHELLSEIFMEVSMDDWKAPLTLQGVSRWWRDVIVDTPRAWTFIPLFDCDKAGQPELCSLFVERGRNAALHLFSEDDHLRSQIQSLAHRIDCMVLYRTFDSMTYFVPGEYDFTRLERLHIDANGPNFDSDRMFKVSEWNMMRFPNLKFLKLAVWDSLLVTMAASPQFPLIRDLQVSCDDPSPLTDILVKCAKSLESIYFYYSDPPSMAPDTISAIHLPFLRYIRLADTSDVPGPHWYINASTPNLEAYFDDGPWQTIDTFKLDLDNVSFLGVIKPPELSRFPRLANFFLSGGGDSLKDLMESITYLRKHPQYSPELAVIQHNPYISDKGQKRAEAALLAYAEETGRRVKLERMDWQKLEETKTRLVAQPCPKHMPCHSIYG